MDSLPPELIRYFISFLPLTSLIAARGVNSQWRALAQTAPLHPARKTLLDIYLAAIVHPNFPSLMEALEPNLYDPDREEYLADLRSDGCVLPDIFEFWVLEWPTKAVHFWAWPGIEPGAFVEHDYYCYWHCNALCEDYHVIHDIPVPNGEVGKTCRALALWGTEGYPRRGEILLWLVVDPNEEMNDRRAGSVVWTHTSYSTDEPVHRILDDPPFRTPNFIEFLKLLDMKSSIVDSTLDRMERVQWIN